MASTFKTQTAEGPLLLADIGGYTAFLQAVAEAHRDDAFADGAVPEAYRLMSSLLDGIVGCIVPPFTLSKIEGDAVFVFAAGLRRPGGSLCSTPFGPAMRISMRDSPMSARSGRAPAPPACERRALISNADDGDLRALPAHRGVRLRAPLSSRRIVAPRPAPRIARRGQ